LPDGVVAHSQKNSLTSIWELFDSNEINCKIDNLFN
jgi:hypothetical protein